MMRSGTVFYKTERGEREIQQRRGELSLRDRRILMLINGARTLEEIEQLARTARVENASSILDALVSAGFITYFCQHFRHCFQVDLKIEVSSDHNLLRIIVICPCKYQGRLKCPESRAADINIRNNLFFFKFHSHLF